MGLELKEIRECSMLILQFCFLCQCLIINVSYGGRCGIRWKLEKHRDSDVLGVKDNICDNQQTEGYHVVWDGCVQNDHFIDMVYREMLNAHSL
jgi:hypothetical protein